MMIKHIFEVRRPSKALAFLVLKGTEMHKYGNCGVFATHVEGIAAKSEGENSEQVLFCLALRLILFYLHQKLISHFVNQNFGF